MIFHNQFKENVTKSKHKKLLKVNKKDTRKNERKKNNRKIYHSRALCSLQYCGDSTNTLNCWLMSLSVSEIEFGNK